MALPQRLKGVLSNIAAAAIVPQDDSDAVATDDLPCRLAQGGDHVVERLGRSKEFAEALQPCISLDTVVEHAHELGPKRGNC